MLSDPSSHVRSPFLGWNRGNQSWEHGTHLGREVGVSAGLVRAGIVKLRTPVDPRQRSRQPAQRACGRPTATVRSPFMGCHHGCHSWDLVTLSGWRYLGVPGAMRCPTRCRLESCGKTQVTIHGRLQRFPFVGCRRRHYCWLRPATERDSPTPLRWSGLGAACPAQVTFYGMSIRSPFVGRCAVPLWPCLRTPWAWVRRAWRWGQPLSPMRSPDMGRCRGHQMWDGCLCALETRAPTPAARAAPARRAP